MRKLLLSVLTLAAIQISTPLVASADDDDLNFGDSVPLVRVLQNAVLPPGTGVALSLSNVYERKNPDESATPCNPVEGHVSFIGSTGSSSESFSTNHFSTATGSLKLLDKIPVNLAPGDVMNVEFTQPYSGTETVLMALTIPSKSKRCLAASSATVQIPGGGLAFNPSASVGETSPYILTITGSLEDGGVCCPCAPVCGCGLCDP